MTEPRSFDETLQRDFNGDVERMALELWHRNNRLADALMRIADLTPRERHEIEFATRGKIGNYHPKEAA